jgi:FkbM family methyltransferase
LVDLLLKSEHLAKGSKWTRFAHHPWRYIFAFVFRKCIYPFTKREVKVNRKLFYGKDMVIALPASTDIYLTGGKSHDSELRLAKYLMHELDADSNFLDIGAHYGYFTLLAANIIKGRGRIASFEPTASSYNLLRQNTLDLSKVYTYQQAVSNTDDDLIFYEFPNAQSEYNTSDIAQFEKAEWYDAKNVVKHVIKATTIDLISLNELFVPSIIKIDVEGAEYKVLKGGEDFFTKYNPIVIMEYLHPTRSNENHVKAVTLMRQLGYRTHVINEIGSLVEVNDLEAYIIQKDFESDNVVFLKG